MYYRNAQAKDPVKIIVILIVTVAIIFSWILLLVQSQDIHIDEKKIQTQLIYSKILEPGCFFEEYAIINRDKLNNGNLEECVKGFDKIGYVEVKLTKSDKNSELGYMHYPSNIDSKEAFSLCEFKNANQLCNAVSFPIFILNSTNSKLEEAVIEIKTVIT